jgi:hypothetical protein
VTGFVKNKDLPPNLKLDKLKIGQVLMFRFRNGEKSGHRVIELLAVPEIDIGSDEKAALGELTPGQHLNTLVHVNLESLV